MVVCYGLFCWLWWLLCHWPQHLSESEWCNCEYEMSSDLQCMMYLFPLPVGRSEDTDLFGFTSEVILSQTIPINKRQGQETRFVQIMFEFKSNVDFMKFNDLQEHVSVHLVMFSLSSFFKVQDCHVIKYLPKEEYDGHTAALVVGGKNASPFYVRIIDD